MAESPLPGLPVEQGAAVKTERYEDEAGVLMSFGLSIAYIGLGTIVRVLSENPQVTNVRRRRPFSSFSGVHARFDFAETECIVLEPHGDNSYFQLGAEEGAIDMTEVHRSFVQYVPPWYRRTLGSIVTLDFLKRR